jgi:hypothetical protein
VIGCVWFLAYWLRKRKEWRWEAEMPLLLLVSLFTSPYSWTYDMVIVLPAIIFVGIKILLYHEQGSFNKTDIFIIASYGVINILNISLHTRLNEFWFGWLGPALLALYLFSSQRLSVGRYIE